MGKDINKSIVNLRIADKSELEKFKADLQHSFRISAEKEFCHTLDKPIPSDSDIDESFKSAGAIVYQVLLNDNIVGGAIVSIDETTQHNKLLLFFILNSYHSRCRVHGLEGHRKYTSGNKGMGNFYAIF